MYTCVLYCISIYIILPAQNLGFTNNGARLQEIAKQGMYVYYVCYVCYVCVYVYKYYVCVYVCAYVYKYYVCVMYVCMYMCMYVCMYVCMNVHTCA